MSTLAAPAPYAGLPSGSQGAASQVMQQTWQDAAADGHIRANLTRQIIDIFAKKRGTQMQNWGQRLHDFVRRLEEQLYITARTKEEYLDPNTLENRLQFVARSMAPKGQGNMPGAGVQANQVQQQGPPQPPVQSNGAAISQQPALPPGMVPTPGQPTGMVPTPGQPPMGMGGPMGSMSSAGGPGSLGMQYPGGPAGNPGPAVGPNPGMSGFIPTPGMFGGADMMDMQLHLRNPSGLANGGAANGPGLGGMVPMGMDGTGGNNLMGHGGPGFGQQGMMRNGGQMGFGMNPQGALTHPGPGPRTSMSGQGTGMIPNMGLPQGPPYGMGMGMNLPGPGGQGMVPAQQPGPANGADLTDHARTQYVQKQQRWLLFLRHCAKCRQSETECQLQAQCKFGKQLWQHILHCASQNCEYPRCSTSKDLLKHHQKCQSPQCPICAPVKEYVRKTRMQQQQQQLSQQSQQTSSQQPGMPQPPQPPQQAPQPPAAPGAPQPPQPGHPGMPNPNMMMGGVMPPYPPPFMAPPAPPIPPAPAIQGQKRPHPSNGNMAPFPQPPVPGSGSMPGLNPYMQGPMGIPQDQAAPSNKRGRAVDDPALGRNTYTSLLETFTPQQIRHHKELILNAQAQQRNNQAPPANPSDICTVCSCTKLLYEPPVLYCSMCGLKIKRTQVYWATAPEASDPTLKGCWCHQCYTDAKGGELPLFGADSNVKKSDLIKRKNDEEIEEPWVQCDMCESWVHQICGLFNKGRNTNNTHYLCPDCLIKTAENGQRSRIETRPQSMLECKDLPHCELSKYLENRVITSLAHERQERAAKEGRPVHEVPTAEALSIRVINNVIKKCEVKPRFADAFGGEYNYPVAFPYRQRVLLLFQNLDGVDVCLFCMYVQEYGEDCPAPNTNCVYLSYLDSVKYFRPEVAAATPKDWHKNGLTVGTYSKDDVALRTYVYHQILIGYLSYVKMLGYEQMYIWACPPMQGDDYILYCHPHKQKTPRSDRLRAWYLDMIRLARLEGIVIHHTTLWDTYFQGGKDHRLEKCSATSIPYLEGDYWPGEAENQLATIAEGQRAANKANPGKGNSAIARAAKGKRYGSGPASMDETLMEKLGEILGGNMKEDFIVVHLQEVCTFCRKHVTGGNMLYRYRSQSGQPMKAVQERKFEGIKLEPGPNVPVAPVTSLTVCEACYSEEVIRHQSGLKSRLPASVTPAELMMEKLEMQEHGRVKDPDPDTENEFFETRQSFLSLCQGNHYQFDTLRRAKHSSMMVLYHLHNPSEPAFAATCNLCQKELEAGSGFRCTVCQDFDICADCKTYRGHEHPLVPSRPYDETRMRMTEAERRERNETMQRTMALLVHACACNNPACSSSSCRKVRALFQHAVSCPIKLNGNCATCKKMWCLLTLHAKSCTKPDCQVPRCKEIKEMRRRQMARQEEQRRKAYQAMLRKQHNMIQQGH